MKKMEWGRKSQQRIRETLQKGCKTYNCDKYIIYLSVYRYLYIYLSINREKEREKYLEKIKLNIWNYSTKNQYGRFKGKQKNYMSIVRNMYKLY